MYGLLKRKGRPLGGYGPAGCEYLQSSRTSIRNIIRGYAHTFIHIYVYEHLDIFHIQVSALPACLSRIRPPAALPCSC